MAAPASTREHASSPAKGPGWALGLEETGGSGALDERIRSGFPASAAQRLMRSLDIGCEEAARLLGVSARTLARRQEEGHLKPAESDRLYRYTHLFERATAVLGSTEQARTWLKDPQWGLGDRVPIHFAETEAGAREVEDLLGRIKHGVLA